MDGVRQAEDGTAVPVQALYSATTWFLFFGMSSRNSIAPRLRVGESGIHYRIVGEASWPFAEMEQVDVRKPWFGGPRVLFLGNRNRRVLAAAVADFEIARRLIAALPASVPLSREAATLRDGNADAATPGLRRYGGVVR